MEAIQRQTGYQATHIRRVLTDAGLMIRASSGMLTPVVLAEVVRLTAAGTPTELVTRYGVTPQAVSQAVLQVRSAVTRLVMLGSAPRAFRQTKALG